MLLNRLRQSVAGWMAKTLIAVLVVSFALWGIGDVFSRSPDPAIAEIGSEDIPVSRFQRFFGLAFNQMQQRARQQGQELDLAQARQLGLDRQVLFTLINQATLEQSADAFGLQVSDQKIVQDIRQDPVFQGAFGSFDRLNFEQTLQGAGMIEADYISERRKEHLRRQFITIFAATPKAPTMLVNQIYKAQNQRRTAQYIVLKTSLVPQPAPPADQVLEDFITANPDLFRQKEQRSFSVLVLEPKDFLSAVKISGKRVRQEYEARLAQFKTPEQRQVQQITFPNKKAAQKARRKINGGTPFDKIAEAQKLSQQDISLGWLTEGEYLAPELAKAAKKLRKGDVSQVVEGPLGPVLLHVQDIKPAQQKTFREAQKELRERLALDMALDEIYAVHNLIEDERASGQRLAQIAKKYGRILNVSNIKAGDALPKNLPEMPGLIEQVFSSAQNDDLAAARTEQNGYYWLEVTQITPPKTPALTQARAKALRLWRQAERYQRLQARAEQMVQKGALGATLKSLTKQKIRTTPPLARAAKSKAFTPDLIEALFRAPVGAFVKGASFKPSEIIVMRVASITSAQASSKERSELKKRIQQELRQLSANETLAQYITRAQNEYGLAVHENNIQLAFDTLTQNFR